MCILIIFVLSLNIKIAIPVFYLIPIIYQENIKNAKHKDTE